MTLLASTWLLMAVVMCGFAWVAGKRLAALSLPLAVALAAFAIYVPTGTPRFTRPPAGKYAVLGSRIDVNIAIYVLLDNVNGAPVYYRLPYTNSQANALQAAKDGSPDGQGITANIDGEGGAQFDGPPPVQGDPPKTPETPTVSIP
ncbi:MAG: hypothetical protein EKK41_05075 [Hyphomicrobiales bacterium]|nr:MAG: hypothetical protein EKK41_05075 [Hyphomicrobiales bacterium]